MQFDNQKTRNVADVAARIMAGESAKQEPQMLEEELVGNQHKIDANKNKKIDAHDFKLLRAQKDKEKANSQKFGKDVKEEVEELAESHFKIGDKVKCKTSGMKGEVVKLDKEEGGEDEKYYTIKREDGEMKKMAPNELTKINEEVEELDEESVHKKVASYLLKSFGHPMGGPNARYTDHQLKKGYDRVAPEGTKINSRLVHRHVDDQTGRNFFAQFKMPDHSPEQLAKMSPAQRSAVERMKSHISRDKMKEETEIDEAMFPGTKEYEKKYGQSPQQKLKKKGDTVPTAQGEMKKTEKGVMHTRRFSEMVSAYQEQGLKYIASLVQEEPDNEEFTKEVEEVKKKATQKKTPEDEGRVAKAAVQAVKNEETEIQVINADIANGVQFDNIEERSLTEPEMKKKEEIVKSMKKGMEGFKQRYGDRAKQVAYATATKIAKEKA